MIYELKSEFKGWRGEKQIFEARGNAPMDIGEEAMGNSGVLREIFRPLRCKSQAK